MLLLVAALVVALFTGEAPNTDVDDFPSDFQKVVDDEATYLLGQAMVFLTGIFVALLGTALYVLLRDRDRLLALMGLAGFLMMGVLFSMSAAAYVSVHSIANNLEAGDVFADEATVQEIGRTLVELGDGTFFLGITFFAIGLLAFGAIIALTRVGIGIAPVAPPKWIGWIALTAGVLFLLGWLALAAEFLFVFVIIAFVLTLIWYLTFGVWLLRAPAEAPTALP